jgi:hypothetical protein
MISGSSMAMEHVCVQVGWQVGCRGQGPGSGARRGPGCMARAGLQCQQTPRAGSQAHPHYRECEGHEGAVVNVVLRAGRRGAWHRARWGVAAAGIGDRGPGQGAEAGRRAYSSAPATTGSQQAAYSGPPGGDGAGDRGRRRSRRCSKQRSDVGITAQIEGAGSGRGWGALHHERGAHVREPAPRPSAEQLFRHGRLYCHCARGWPTRVYCWCKRCATRARSGGLASVALRAGGSAATCTLRPKPICMSCARGDAEDVGAPHGELLGTLAPLEPQVNWLKLHPQLERAGIKCSGCVVAVALDLNSY